MDANKPPMVLTDNDEMIDRSHIDILIKERDDLLENIEEFDRMYKDTTSNDWVEYTNAKRDELYLIDKLLSKNPTDSDLITKEKEAHRVLNEVLDHIEGVRRELENNRSLLVEVDALIKKLKI